MADQDDILVTQNLANIVAGNVGVQFSPATLTAAAAGRVQWLEGCVTRMLYNTSGRDLDGVQISGDHPGWVAASNLNEFKERFEEAACCGHGVAFCVTDEGKRIVMLHVYPCKCTCERKEDH